MSSENLVETDVLVIGGGVAGCFAAVKAREQGLDVTIVDKGYAGKSGASIAASGHWGVYNPEWGHDFDGFMNIVNVNGEYVNNREWGEIVLNESWETYEDLISWGVEFPVETDKMRDYYKVIPVSKARTGPTLPPSLNLRVPLRHRKVSPVLRKQAGKVGVNIVDRIIVTDLLEQDRRVVGAIGFPTDSYDLYIFRAKATILSSGSNCFRAPGMHEACLTGDAEAMAYRAGAELTGKEFPDTHCNLSNYPAWKSNGELYAAHWCFADGEGKQMSTAPELLGMDFKVHAGIGPIFWDIDNAGPEDIKAMQEYTRKRGNPVELERTGLDVTGGGKYQCIGGASAGRSVEESSGLWPINTKCATILPGLYAAGDCCATRISGASLTALWCLTGAAVTGKRAGVGAAEYALQAEKPVIDEEELARLKKIVYRPAERKGGFSPRWVTQLLQNTMMPYFILHVKHEKRLQAALTIVEFMRDHLVPKLFAKDVHELRLAHETKNMVLNAEMILRSSLFRTESRGVHYREDYPRRDDPTWLAWVKLKEEQGGMKLWKEPVPKEWWPDLSKPYEERYPVRFPGE